MGKSFKLLFAAVMLMAVMCAGAAFAADTVTVDLKISAQLQTYDQGVGDPTPVPNDQIRLWVTRRGRSIEKKADLMDTKGNDIRSYLILYSTKPAADSTAGEWLSVRGDDGYGNPALGGYGNIGETGISYNVFYSSITLSADVSARSGDRATVYVYGGVSGDQGGTTVTSVQVDDGQGMKNVTPFPSEEISWTGNTKNGGVITSFDVVVLSSDAEIILDQIESDPTLELAPGSNIVVKDAAGAVTDVVTSADPQPLIIVELAGNGSEIVVVSSDGSDIDQRYTWGMDPYDARAYLKDGDTTIFTFTPVIDPNGTITYRMDDPGLLQALAGRLGKELTLVFDDLNSTHGMAIPECLVQYVLSVGGGSSSGICGAGAAALVGLAALAVIKRRSR